METWTRTRFNLKHRWTGTNGLIRTNTGREGKQTLLRRAVKQLVPLEVRSTRSLNIKVKKELQEPAVKTEEMKQIDHEEMQHVLGELKGEIIFELCTKVNFQNFVFCELAFF